MKMRISCLAMALGVFLSSTSQALDLSSISSDLVSSEMVAKTLARIRNDKKVQFGMLYLEELQLQTLKFSMVGARSVNELVDNFSQEGVRAGVRGGVVILMSWTDFALLKRAVPSLLNNVKAPFQKALADRAIRAVDQDPKNWMRTLPQTLIVKPAKGATRFAWRAATNWTVALFKAGLLAEVAYLEYNGLLATYMSEEAFQQLKMKVDIRLQEIDRAKSLIAQDLTPDISLPGSSGPPPAVPSAPRPPVEAPPTLQD